MTFDYDYFYQIFITHLLGHIHVIYCTSVSGTTSAMVEGEFQ